MESVIQNIKVSFYDFYLRQYETFQDIQENPIEALIIFTIFGFSFVFVDRWYRKKERRLDFFDFTFVLFASICAIIIMFIYVGFFFYSVFTKNF